jgi:hypothetical protein
VEISTNSESALLTLFHVLPPTAGLASRLLRTKDGDMAACLICSSEADFRSDGSVKTCPRCGQYELPGSGGWDIVETPNQQVPISAWIRQQNGNGIIPFITLETLRSVRCMPIPSLRDRANGLLVELVKRYPRFNDGFVIPTLCDDLALQAVTYSADQRELNDLFASSSLFQVGWVTRR